MSTSPSLPRRAGARPRGLALAALTAAGTALLAPSATAAAPGDYGDVKFHMKADTDVNRAINQPNYCDFQMEAYSFDVAQGLTWTIEPQPMRAGSTILSGQLALSGGAGRTEDYTLPEGQYKLTWRVMNGLGTGKQKVFKVDCPNRPDQPDRPLSGSPAEPGERHSPDELNEQSSPDEFGEKNGQKELNEQTSPDEFSEQNGQDELSEQTSPDELSEQNGQDELSEQNSPEELNESSDNHSEPSGLPNGGPPAGGGGLAPQTQDYTPVAGAVAAGLTAVGTAAYFGLRRRRPDGAA